MSSNSVVYDEHLRNPDKALRLVLAHSWNPIAYQILNPGILHWFNDKNDAVIGYAVANRIRVVAGAPICRPTILLDVTKDFEADAKANGEHVCYFHVGPRFASVLSRSGVHSIARIGSLPYWNPTDWYSILKSDGFANCLCRIRARWIARSHIGLWSVADSR